MQSYILQLLLFVFITGWFVTPSHEPETKKKKKKKILVFYLGKGISIASFFLSFQ